MARSKKHQRVVAASDKYIAVKNAMKLEMISWAKRKVTAEKKALPLQDAKRRSEDDAASEASDSGNSETSAVSSNAN